jgi:hypothetical protein
MKAPTYGRDGWMAIAAFRYCLGRQSHIVGSCADWLIDQWASLAPNVQQTIERDLREEFKRDDYARANVAGDRPLGSDCDRADWQKVLNAIDAHKAAAGL